jgi:hypothetical protein
MIELKVNESQVTHLGPNRQSTTPNLHVKVVVNIIQYSNLQAERREERGEGKGGEGGRGGV